MGFFDFIKGAGKESAEEQEERFQRAKAASNAARAAAQAQETAAAGASAPATGGGAAAQGAAGGGAPTTTAPAPVTVPGLEAKIKASKIEVKDLALKVDDDKVKVYGVVQSADDKADLILVVGNTPGVARVEDAIKVRKPGSDKDEDDDKVPAPRFYQVKSGDTLSAIAGRELGDANRYMDIFNANRNILRDPDEIDIGQTLRIPAR